MWSSELARQVGLALHNVQLDSALQESLEEVQRTNAELVESRLRIVTAGDAQRRRLERDLHDGAQQHLVAMAVKLRLAEDLTEDDPAEAASVIVELRRDLQDAIAELRALAHGIFPPLLSSGGLMEALPAAASRSALVTSVEFDGVGRYTPEIEAAVYFCCLEALQNAGKHAGERATALVRVTDAGALRFEVVDDGVGFDTRPVGDRRPRLREHGRPPRGDRRQARRRLEPRRRHDDPGRDPAARLSGQDGSCQRGKSGSPPASQRARMPRPPKSSFAT